MQWRSCGLLLGLMVCISGIELMNGIDKDGIENEKHEEKTKRRLTRQYLKSLVMTVVNVCPDYKST